MPETLAIWSHLSHGVRPEIGNVAIPAPWLAIIERDSRSVSFLSTPGRLRAIHLGQRDWWFMTFHAPLPREPKYVRSQAEVMALYYQRKGLGYRVRPATILGVQYSCYEATDSAINGALEVSCVSDQPATMRISYHGSSARVEEFYSVLSKIEAKRARQ